jgi:Tfp pilus assembly protein PilO
VNKKPALIAVAVGAILAVIMVVALIAPKASQVRTTNKKVDEATALQASLQTQLERLQAEAKDAPKERKKLKSLETQIPSTADLPGLIRTLNATAEKSGVDFATLAPGNPTGAGALTVIPIQITIKGTFFATDQYLYLLENLPRVSKVVTISITPGDDLGPPPQLIITMTANFFTTDVSAGPGSDPGATEAIPAPAPSPSASPSEG